jgi:hypothetical protein
VIVLALMAAACDPDQDPPPIGPSTAVFAQYQLSGTVTDDAGAAVEGAAVEVRYWGRSDDDYDSKATVMTDVTGRYSFSIEAGPADRLDAFMRVTSPTDGYEDVAVTSVSGTNGTRTIVRNFSLRRIRTLIAGESATVSCDVRGCESLRFTADQTATLTIEAGPLQPLIEIPAIPGCRGFGIAECRVDAGKTYRIQFLDLDFRDQAQYAVLARFLGR